MKVVILYPNSNAARAIGVRLLETGHCVSIYCPHEVDRVKAGNMKYELDIIGQEQNRIRKTQDRFSIHTGSSFDNFEVLVVQSLDVQSKNSDQDYVKMVNGLFKTMHENGCSFAPDAHIVFGSNYGGILAATAWCRFWPESRKQIIVTCSIYLASVKISGVDSEDRALPTSRNPINIVFTDKPIKEVKALEGTWNLDSFSSLEQKAILEVIDSIDKNAIESIEVVGKFPDTNEANKYNISQEKPIWLPTSGEDLTWYTEFFPKLKAKWPLEI